MLVSEPDGCALRVGEGRLDLACAERLAAEAEQARHSGDPDHARELLSQAVELWKGESLAGVPGPYGAAWRARLEERRLGLVEDRLPLDLEAGRHAEVVAELTAPAAGLRERVWELLMLAFSSGDRQTEALAAYADTRRLLALERGVAPSLELSELRRRSTRAGPRPPAPEGAPKPGRWWRGSVPSGSASPQHPGLHRAVPAGRRADRTPRRGRGQRPGPSCTAPAATGPAPTPSPSSTTPSGGPATPDRAQACWQEALETYETLGSPEAPAVRRLLRAAGPRR
ncbi:AfsR/SARP family transcriptional regulator [Streptomyces chrestomyceticus]|uniref:AfsR/SARP family transcriptional regulator n=1 Tax=Streptomyces chrestomyceticus TaxID=68185 RepID=UPI0033F19911